MNQALQDAQGSLRAGDKVAEDTWTERLVVVPQEQPQGLRPIDVVVWDLLDEENIRTIQRHYLTPSLNEMQVIAFMVDSGECSCCGIDGGRVRKVRSESYCSECFKGVCDERGQGKPCRKVKDPSPKKEKISE